MGDYDHRIDPECLLAIAYAPSIHRAALRILWGLDARLGAVVAATREPALGQIRLLWWREALVALDDPAAPRPIDPLLQAVALLPGVVRGEELAGLEAGWSALLDDDRDVALDTHGQERGGRLFALSAQLLGIAPSPDICRAGAGWALVDLVYGTQDVALGEAAMNAARRQLDGLAVRDWPKAARPLAILTRLAQADVRSPRPRRQGSPSRLLRVMRTGLFGA